MVKSSDLNFNDVMYVMCFVTYIEKVDLGFFSQTGLVLFPLHFKGFSNRFYRFWGLLGKLSEHEVSFAKMFAFLRAFFEILSFVNIEGFIL